MVSKNVLMLGNPKLRDKSKNVEEFDDNFQERLQDLKDTLIRLQEVKKLGRALAAPQIGYQERFITYNFPNKAFTMVNPVIKETSKEMIWVWDSCYCFDVAFFIEIERFERIVVEYQDEQGTSITEEYLGDMSVLVQHEIDHLEGILATDHIKDPHKIMIRSEWEKIYH